MTGQTSQIFESYVPVYDTIPEKWEEGRQFLVEHLKKISNAVNIREIGWYLDEEVLSGKQFFPAPTTTTGADPSQQFRSMFRLVVDFSPLTPGLNTKPHNIVIDQNFRLIALYGACSDTVALTGHPINQPNITYDVTNIYMTSDGNFQYAQAVMEYIAQQ